VDDPVFAGLPPFRLNAKQEAGRTGKIMTNIQRILTVTFLVLLVAAIALPANTLSQDQMRIVEQVRSKIERLDTYGVFDNISFGLDGTKVILNGYASKPTLKKSAERVVKKIEGVSEVENNIKVLPHSRMDDDVRWLAYAKIYGHPSLSRYNPNRGVPMWITPARISNGITQDPPRGHHPIQIIVRNGNITLEGVVDNTMDSQLAETQANTVPGAFSVTNNRVVLNPQAKAD
jgi:osmotically-inducible protein OsmY